MLCSAVLCVEQVCAEQVCVEKVYVEQMFKQVCVEQVCSEQVFIKCGDWLPSSCAVLCCSLWCAMMCCIGGGVASGRYYKLTLFTFFFHFFTLSDPGASDSECVCCVASTSVMLSVLELLRVLLEGGVLCCVRQGVDLCDS